MAKEDLLSDNGYLFTPYNVAEIESSVRRMMNMSDTELDLAQCNSVNKAKEINVGKFVHSVLSFM